MKKILVATTALLLTLHAWAQVPKTISFQGYLTDENDNAIHNLDGIPMTFTLFAGSSPEWGPESHTVKVDNGRYSVILGDGTPPVSFDNVDFNVQYELEIIVDGKTLTPRIPLTSSPYSLGVGNIITSTMIENDAANDSRRAITTNHIKDNSVTSAKLLSDAFNDAQRAVTTDHIKDEQITTAKIATDAVTVVKIGTAGNSDANKVLNTDASGDPRWSTISNAQIGSGQVTVDKLASSGAGDANKVMTTNGTGSPQWTTITNAMLGTDQVTADKIGTAGAGDANKAFVTNGSGDPSWSTITNAMIGTDQVTAAKIGTSGSSDGNKVLSTNASGDPSWTTISTAMIADDQVTIAKMVSGGAGDANKILVTNGSGDPSWSTAVTNTQLPAAISQTTVSASDYMRADGGLFVGATFSDPANNLIVSPTSRVGIGTTSAPTYTLEIEQASTNSNYVMRVNKQSTNAGLIRFDRGATLLGYIYEGGGTLHFGPFTGSHLADAKTEIAEGSIVSFSGDLTYLSEQSTEPVYGVKVSSKANDPSVLGVYLGRINDETNDHMAVAAVGNGDMWVIDNGKDIQPGDLLITSDVEGHAMVDNGRFGTWNVIARAAQTVTWSNESQLIDGKKHKRISVLFESMVVNNDVKKLEEEINDLRKEIAALKSLIKH